MPRRYTVTFENVLIAGPQDLVTIFSPPDQGVRIFRAWLSNTDTTLASSQMFQVRSRFLRGILTAGSGGTVPTPRPVDPGDNPAFFTAHVNDTSKTTTNGQFYTIDANGFHVYAGYDWEYNSPPILYAGTGSSVAAFVFELLSTPSGTCHFSGGLEVEELG